MNVACLKIVEKAPTSQEYLQLRKDLKWELYPEDNVEYALQNSLHCVSVYYNDQIVGMGRIVGDGRLCFYLQDIMVASNAQRQGIGSIIMDNLMTYLHNAAVAGAYIGLMSKKGKESFYEQYGFVPRPNNTMGHGMILPYFIPNEC